MRMPAKSSPEDIYETRQTGDFSRLHTTIGLIRFAPDRTKAKKYPQSQMMDSPMRNKKYQRANQHHFNQRLRQITGTAPTNKSTPWPHPAVTDRV